MSKAIAKLLNKPEHLVADVVKKLEDSNGGPSEDVRLLAENVQKLRIKLSQLGLDPSDTTGEELYHALRARFIVNGNQVDAALGIDTNASLALRVAKATQLVAGLGALPEMWLLKHSVAKSLARQMPPKKTMRKLGYRSVESLLKRENIDNVYLGADWLESEAWRAGMSKRMSKLGSAGFEMRALQVSEPPETYWENTRGSKSYVTTNARLGVAALCPASLPDGAQVLSLAIALLDNLEKLSGTELISRFCELNPALRWWADSFHLLASRELGPVSLNIKDISRDCLDDRNYSERSNRYGAKAMFSTLLGRYQNQAEELADAAKNIGYNLTSSGSEVPFGAQLATEYDMVE